MLEVMPETRDNIVAIKFSGRLSEHDFDSCAQQLEGIYGQEIPLCALFDWQDLEGWDKGAKSVGMWFGMHHRATVKRIAIIAEPKWYDEVIRISDLYNVSEVRRFALAERNAAWEWLRSD